MSIVQERSQESPDEIFGIQKTYLKFLCVVIPIIIMFWVVIYLICDRPNLFLSPDCKYLIGPYEAKSIEERGPDFVRFTGVNGTKMEVHFGTHGYIIKEVVW